MKKGETYKNLNLLIAIVRGPPKNPRTMFQCVDVSGDHRKDAGGRVIIMTKSIMLALNSLKQNGANSIMLVLNSLKQSDARGNLGATKLFNPLKCGSHIRFVADATPQAPACSHPLANLTVVVPPFLFL